MYSDTRFDMLYMLIYIYIQITDLMKKSDKYNLIFQIRMVQISLNSLWLKPNLNTNEKCSLPVQPQGWRFCRSLSDQWSVGTRAVVLSHSNQTQKGYDSMIICNIMSCRWSWVCTEISKKKHGSSSSSFFIIHFHFVRVP